MHLTQLTASAVPSRTLMSASERTKQFYRHLGLWVLQSWLAMFFIAAAVAKLGQPQDLLNILLDWPERVDPAVVRYVGVAELVLGAGLLAPVISWRWFRPVLLLSAAALLGETLMMGAYHAISGHPGLAVVNACLCSMTIAVLLGRRRHGGETRA
ncbi:MAG: DoxX family protein [Pseudomonadota bacterium]|nr:DoxX family protein [Pseudomonadota bacterium]